MEKKEDRRTKMTKDFLKHGLTELMKKKSINDISVKELCDLSDVNRSTFYKHYATITELYEDMINDIAENILYISRLAREGGYIFKAKYVEAILNYVENNRDLFLVILSVNGNIGFGEFMVNSTDKVIGDFQIPDFYKYCLYFVVSGMSSIIWKWLNEEKRMPAHSLAILISSLMYHGIDRAGKFALNAFDSKDGTEKT